MEGKPLNSYLIKSKMILRFDFMTIREEMFQLGNLILALFIDPMLLMYVFR